MHGPRRFTLIELLVVIAIIATLAAMLLPALTASRGRARLIACMGQQRQMTQALLLYADDAADQLPVNPALHELDGCTWMTPPIWYSWWNVSCPSGARPSLGKDLEDYGVNARLAYCPLGPGMPTNAATEFPGTSVSLMAGYAPVWRYTRFSGVTFKPARKLTDQGSTLLLVDQMSYSAFSSRFFSAHPLPGGQAEITTRFGHWVGPTTGTQLGLNASYLDGHSRLYRWQDLQRATWPTIDAGFMYLPRDL